MRASCVCFMNFCLVLNRCKLTNSMIAHSFFLYKNGFRDVELMRNNSTHALFTKGTPVMLPAFVQPILLMLGHFLTTKMSRQIRAGTICRPYLFRQNDWK